MCIHWRVRGCILCMKLLFGGKNVVSLVSACTFKFHYSNPVKKLKLTWYNKVFQVFKISKIMLVICHICFCIRPLVLWHLELFLLLWNLPSKICMTFWPIIQKFWRCAFMGGRLCCIGYKHFKHTQICNPNCHMLTF